MSLSDCQKCQYLDRNSNHSEDIICAVNPAYSTVWKRLKDLDSFTLDSAPVDVCRDFQLDPTLERKEFSLTLSLKAWRQLARESSESKLKIINALDEANINLNLCFSVKQWQTIVNSSTDDRLIEQFEQYEIKPDPLTGWISVTSSCINAIAFDRLNLILLIRFNRGDIYQYSNFSAALFDSFRNANSQGEFFNRNIKDVYAYTKL